MTERRKTRGAQGLLALMGLLVALPGWTDTGAAASQGPPACLDGQMAHATLDGTTPGLPILISVPDGEFATALLYDPGLHDAFTDWGGCMELFRGCYLTSQGPIAGCVAQIPTCSSSVPMQGGDTCCPAQCISDFQSMVNAGVDEDSAVDATVSQGSGCVAGFSDLEAAFDAGDFDAGVSP
jgi:hypothetical protein